MFQLSPNHFVLPVFTALTLLLPSTGFSQSLGLIEVESTTINDRFKNKRTEPSNIGAINPQEVELSHSDNVQKMLQGIPGITTEVQSGDSLKIHIRGIENQVFMGERPGVAVVIDGVPVFERTGKVNIDMDNIESIKVIKGGASYLFGDDALAGAVIITTKRGATNQGYRVSAEAGSFGFTKGLARAGFSSENGSGHLQLSQRDMYGYHDDSASRSDYINGKYQYYIDDFSDITFGLEKSNRIKNSHGTVTGTSAAYIDPKSNNVADYNDYANRFDVELQKLFTTYSRDMGDNNNLMVNVYQFNDLTQYNSAPLDADPSKYAYFNDYNQSQSGLKTEYRSGGETFAWLLAADIRANSYKNQVTNIDCSEAYSACTVSSFDDDNNTDESVQAIYAEVKLASSENMTVTLNGRVDNIVLDYADVLDATKSGEKIFNVSSWRLGSNYALNERSDIYLNISTGFRAPTVTQLFTGSNSPTSKTASNPDLDPEYSINKEIGIRKTSQLFGYNTEIDMALFQIDRSDHIQASMGQYTTGTGSTYENIGDMRNRGLELSMFMQSNHNFSYEIAYTWLDAVYTSYNSFNLQTEPVANTCPAGATPVTGWGGLVSNCLTSYDNTGNDVPRVSDHHLNFKVNHQTTDNLLMTFEMDAISEYKADEINQVTIGGHTVFNLLLNYSKKIAKNQWSIFTRIDNLFDRNYYNTARGYRDANEDGFYNGEDLSIVVNPGRAITAGLTVDF